MEQCLQLEIAQLFRMAKSRAIEVFRVDTFAHFDAAHFDDSDCSDARSFMCLVAWIALRWSARSLGCLLGCFCFDAARFNEAADYSDARRSGGLGHLVVAWNIGCLVAPLLAFTLLLAEMLLARCFWSIGQELHVRSLRHSLPRCFHSCRLLGCALASRILWLLGHWSLGQFFGCAVASTTLAWML